MGAALPSFFLGVRVFVLQIIFFFTVTFLNMSQSMSCASFFIRLFCRFNQFLRVYGLREISLVLCIVAGALL